MINGSSQQKILNGEDIPTKESLRNEDKAGEAQETAQNKSKGTEKEQRTENPTRSFQNITKQRLDVKNKDQKELKEKPINENQLS